MKYAVILLSAIAITGIHRFWNNAPVNSVNWFIIGEKEQDVQWYIKDSFEMIGGIMTVYVLWKLAQMQSKRLSDVVQLIMIYKVMNFAGYWINFNTYDYFFIIAIIPIGLILILLKRK